MDTIKKALNDSAVMRWGVLLLVSFTMAVNYYFYDALSPLKDLMEQKLNFSSSDYGFLMSTYSIPNVFLAMAVIGGVILDKIGIRITGFIFVLFMVVGAVITSYGATEMYNQGGFGYDFMASFLPGYSPALKMMSLGYFFFGLGAETSCVVISKIIVKWFKGKELALALGSNIAIARLGTAASLIISPKLVNPEWTQPIWFGALLLAIGFLAFLVYILIDIRFDRSVSHLEEEEEEPFRISDIGKLLTNPSFLFIAMLCVTFYSAVFPFIKYAPDLMQNKFGVSREIGGTITSILPFGTIVFTPLFGWICDTKGKSATLMIFGSLLLISVHLMFAFTTITPYVPMFILGVAFSLVPAAMWPSVAKIVSENKIGSAYGLMFSIQNIGLWAFPMLIGFVLDNANPNVQVKLSDAEINKFVLTEQQYEGIYLDGDSKPISNEDIKINVLIKSKNNSTLIVNDVYDVKTNENGKYILNLNQIKTNNNLKIIPDDVKMEIKVPLNYTNSLIMLSFLGVLGLVFAFLLKWADKKQGYGLELPNKSS